MLRFHSNHQHYFPALKKLALSNKRVATKEKELQYLNMAKVISSYFEKMKFVKQFS